MTHSVNFSVMEQQALSRRIDTKLLRELLACKDRQTPLLLLSRLQVGRNYRALKKALPRAHIHYAVKPNNHAAVLE